MGYARVKRSKKREHNETIKLHIGGTTCSLESFSLSVICCLVYGNVWPAVLVQNCVYPLKYFPIEPRNRWTRYTDEGCTVKTGSYACFRRILVERLPYKWRLIGIV